MVLAVSFSAPERASAVGCRRLQKTNTAPDEQIGTKWSRGTCMSAAAEECAKTSGCSEETR